jgi:hypothetical protein
MIGKLAEKRHVGNLSFVSRTLQLWKRLPEDDLGISLLGQEI